MNVKDWSKPLVVKGTDRPATVLRGPISGERYQVSAELYQVIADWPLRGQDILLVGSDGKVSGTPYAVENAPEPVAEQPDHEQCMKKAREAAARALESYGSSSMAARVRAGERDDYLEVKSAYLALTQGADLLKPAEPPEVTAARKIVAEWDAMKGEGV